jgi:two-component system phosphate regulon response regulator PhoB
MNILVVEDDRDIRELVCMSLAQNNFTTTGCCDVQEARQLLATLIPDCLVVDWMLADGSGIELIRWMRRKDQYQQIPVLMLTARAQERRQYTAR